MNNSVYSFILFYFIDLHMIHIIIVLLKSIKGFTKHTPLFYICRSAARLSLPLVVSSIVDLYSVKVNVLRNYPRLPYKLLYLTRTESHHRHPATGRMKIGISDALLID